MAGLIAALGGLGGAAKGLADKHIDAEFDAERQARIQEYALARDANSASLREQQAARDFGRTTQRDARQNEYESQGDYRRSGLISKQQAAADARALENETSERARIAGLITSAVNPETLKVDYGMAAELAAVSGDTQLATVLKGLNPSDRSKPVDWAIKEWVDSLQIAYQGLNAARANAISPDQKKAVDVKGEELLNEIRMNLGIKTPTGFKPAEDDMAGIPMNVQQAVQRLRAKGMSDEADELLERAKKRAQSGGF